MKLVEQRDAAVLLFTRGQSVPKVLKLSDKEIATLQAARDICMQAADLLNEDDTGDFTDAEARLAEILNESQ